jgi:phytoene desaturase
MTALVLGGGFAGLSAAIRLALAGVAVTLIEQLPELGGKAGEVVQDGFRFDTGPSVFTLPQAVSDIFAAAGESLPLRFTPLEPLCRYGCVLKLADTNVGDGQSQRSLESGAIRTV